MSKRRTWTVAIQRSIASHWKLALGCAAAAWLVARFIQGRSSSTTDPAEARRLASERADYFERKGQTAKAARPARKPGSDGGDEACPPAPAQPVRAEDLVSPPRYLPPAESAAEASVSRRDVVQVRDGGYEWQAANALFDTGNESLTVLDAAFARRHGLYAEGGGSGIFAQAEPSPSPNPSPTRSPRPRPCPSPSPSPTPSPTPRPRPSPSPNPNQAERWVTLHGVVPGASVTVPVVTAELRVRGHTFRLQVAVSELGGRTEVLVGIDVIERLWAAGVRIERG